MQESLFACAPAAHDEFCLSQAVRAEEMAKHRSSWISRAEIVQMRRLGLTAVRHHPPSHSQRLGLHFHSASASRRCAAPFGFWALLHLPSPPIISLHLPMCMQVRLPFGFWALDVPGAPIPRKPAPPYTAERRWISGARDYVGPCEHVITHCLDTCASVNLLVHLCLMAP